MKRTKGKIIIVLVLLLSVVTLLVSIPTVRKAKADSRDTWSEGWQLVRDTANEDAATFAAALALATSEGDFANKPTGAFEIKSSNRGESVGTAWCFTFSGIPTNGDNDTFSFTAVGWAKRNGMAQVICNGDGRLGTQDVVIYPHSNTATSTALWADYLSVDSKQDWPGNIGTFPATAADTVAQLVFDTTGLAWVQVFIYDADGSTSDEAGSITVYGRPY